MNPLLLFSIISLIAGLALRYWINRRKFYRRHVTGLEGFSSYEKSVVISFVERIGKWIAYLLILFGMLLYLMYRTDKKTAHPPVPEKTQQSPKK